MKLRKMVGKKEAVSYHLCSAEWCSSDGRFYFARIERDDQDGDPDTRNDGNWQIYCQDFTGDSLIDWLKSLGLWDATFPTRRAAVEALELALEGAVL